MTNLEEKLGVNKYYVNEGHPHIEIIHDYPDMKEKNENSSMPARPVYIP